MHGKIGFGEVGTVFLTDDSLSNLKMHHVGLSPIMSNSVPSGLQNNYTLIVKEFETSETFIIWAIPDLNFFTSY